jgi:hypothetical protein
MHEQICDNRFHRTIREIAMRIASVVCPVILLMLPCVGQELQRGVARPRAAETTSSNGSYYALVIGINAYQHQDRLQTAVGDARAVDALLRERYGFKTKLLLDAQATRANIINAFGEYRRALKENDNLLVFYAGHGTRDGDKAYWLPVDSDPDLPANWIIADEITTGMRVIPARHVLVISDSCYSGGISRDIRANTRPTDHDAAIAKMLSSKSRVLIASGRDEPVADGGGSGHSVFAGALLNGLTRMNDGAFTALSLFDGYIRDRVIGNSLQIPVYQPIQLSGDDGGDFVFFPNSSAGTVASVTRPPGSLPEIPNGRTNPNVVNPSVTPPGATPVAAPRTASPTATARRQGFPLPDDFPKPPPPDSSGALLLTRFRTALLMIRDAPQSLTEDALLPFAKQQVSSESSMWYFIDQAMAGKSKTPYQLNPKRPAFTYEWQKVADSNAVMAKGPLMDLFLRGDADWTFTEKDKDWDAKADVIEDAFVFSKDQVMGKDGKPLDNEFTARRVLPVLQKHLLAAASRAPTRLWFTVMLPPADYDFKTSTVRFKKGAAFEENIEFLEPTTVPLFERPAPGTKTQGFLLPPEARATANYRPWFDGRSILSPTEDVVKPGVIFKSVEDQVIPSPTAAWRDGFGAMARGFPVELITLALDRQLRLAPIPMDAAAAEDVHPRMNDLRAQVFINVSAGKAVEWIGGGVNGNIPYVALFARVEKIKIFDRKGGVIATIDAKTLPLAQAH